MNLPVKPKLVYAKVENPLEHYPIINVKNLNKLAPYLRLLGFTRGEHSGNPNCWFTPNFNPQLDNINEFLLAWGPPNKDTIKRYRVTLPKEKYMLFDEELWSHFMENLTRSP